MKLDYLPPGSHSSGTLRPEDIREMLLDCLSLLNLTDKDQKIVDIIASRDVTSWEYYGSEEFYEDTDVLYDIIDSYIPEGYYFGAHPGDGADFGVWELELGF